MRRAPRDLHRTKATILQIPPRVLNRAGAPDVARRSNAPPRRRLPRASIQRRRHVLAVLAQQISASSSPAVSSTPRPLAASRMILARSASLRGGVECVRDQDIQFVLMRQPTVRLLTLCVPALRPRPHVVRRPVGINPRFPTRARNIATQISAGLWQNTTPVLTEPNRVVNSGEMYK